MKIRMALPPAVKASTLFLARILIGMLFMYSGFSKLIQPAEYFEIAVNQYQIVPEAMTHMISLVMPWIEWIGGAFLLLGYLTEISAGALALLTGAFQIVLGQAVIRKLPIDECGCFGGGFVHLTLYQSFVLDTILVLALIQIATAENHPATLDRYLNQ